MELDSGWRRLGLRLRLRLVSLLCCSGSLAPPSPSMGRGRALAHCAGAVKTPKKKNRAQRQSTLTSGNDRDRNDRTGTDGTGLGDGGAAASFSFFLKRHLIHPPYLPMAACQDGPGAWRDRGMAWCLVVELSSPSPPPPSLSPWIILMPCSLLPSSYYYAVLCLLSVSSIFYLLPLLFGDHGSRQAGRNRAGRQHGRQVVEEGGQGVQTSVMRHGKRQT